MCVLVAILKNELALPRDLYTILRVLDLEPLMTVPLLQLSTGQRPTLFEFPGTNQMRVLET